MSESPLLNLHKKSGASLENSFGQVLPARFSSLQEEYAAATLATAAADRCYVGRLKVAGADAPDLLNRLSTNDLETITGAGQGTSTVLTTNKGRIVDLLTLVRLDDHLLALTGPGNQQRVAEWIDFYTFGEDVAVEDETADPTMIGVTGPGAASLLALASGRDVSTLPRYAASAVCVAGISTLLIRTDFVGPPGYDIVAEVRDAPRLWTTLVEAGARPAGVEALDAVRIESGVPLFGRELTEEANPLEASLLDSISFSKGCYVGQEVVARLNTYDKVKRRLVGLSWDGAVDFEPAGAALSLDGGKVGEVTSAARSPRTGKGIGLGFVAKAQAKPGVLLTLDSPDGRAQARVEETSSCLSHSASLSPNG